MSARYLLLACSIFVVPGPSLASDLPAHSSPDKAIPADPTSDKVPFHAKVQGKPPVRPESVRVPIKRPQDSAPIDANPASQNQ